MPTANALTPVCSTEHFGRIPSSPRSVPWYTQHGTMAMILTPRAKHVHSACALHRPLANMRAVPPLLARPLGLPRCQHAAPSAASQNHTPAKMHALALLCSAWRPGRACCSCSYILRLQSNGGTKSETRTRHHQVHEMCTCMRVLISQTKARLEPHDHGVPHGLSNTDK